MTDSPMMLAARGLVEAHIESYGMVPHPDRLKEAIAAKLDGPRWTAQIGDPHPHWSANNKNEDYPKTVEEWDPHKDPVGHHLKRSVARLRMAIDRDDPRAPDEMALVSRWDLTTLMHDYWQKSAVFELWREDRKKALSRSKPMESSSGGPGFVDEMPVATLGDR